MYDIKVLEARQHGVTGLITVHVAAIETHDNVTLQGPQKTYAIAPDVLAAHYDGDLNKWLNWIKEEHQKYHGLHADVRDQLQSLKGKML